MKQDSRRLTDAYFERDYQEVRPVLERVLPQIKLNGWLYKSKTGKYSRGGNALTVFELEKETGNHYFRTNSELYEKVSPDLPQIHKYWYALLRDFIQRWAVDPPGRIIQKLHEDLGQLFEDEDPRLLEDYVNSPRRKMGLPTINVPAKAPPQ